MRYHCSNCINLKVSIFDNCDSYDSLKDLVDFDLVAPNHLGHGTKFECISK